MVGDRVEQKKRETRQNENRRKKKGCGKQNKKEGRGEENRAGKGERVKNRT